MRLGAVIGILSVVLMAALAPAAAQTAAPPPPPPAEAFGRLPALDVVAISPDGGKLAIIESGVSGVTVSVYSLATTTSVRSVALGEVKARDVSWVGDTHVVLTVGTTQRVFDSARSLFEWTRVISINVATGEQRWLAPGPDAGANVSHDVWGRLPGDSSGVLMDALVFHETAYRSPTGTRLGSSTPSMDAMKVVLYRVDVASGDVRAVAVGERFTRDWLLGADGAIRARSDLDPKTRTFTIFASGASWKSVLTLHDQVSIPISLVAIGPTNDTAYVIDRRGARPALMMLDLRTGALSPPEAPGFQGASNAMVDPETAMISAVYIDGAYQWIEPGIKSAQALLGRALPKMQVDIAGVSKDRSRMLITAESGSAPLMYYLFNTATRALDTVGETYPELAQAALGEKVSTSYPSRDGKTVPAYLTWPRGAERKNLPLVVLPHGGPAGQDYEGFDWLAQFFAARGYAVLQPQFRGSTGQGKEWADAGKQQWGGVMQNDVSDGVTFLTKSGQVDPRRVCIVGASYGGYSALAGATLTPDLYACAVSINGVSDLPLMLRGAKRRGESQGNMSTVNYWSEHIGSPDDPVVRAASPINRVDAVRAPILLIHGEQDTIVPYNQSSNMAEALRKASKDVTLVKLQGEDHGLSNAATRIETLKAIEPFVAKALAPPR